MSKVEKLKEELALAELQEAHEVARAKMRGPSPSEDDRAEFRATRDTFAAARTAFREKYPPTPPAPGDAVATPETLGVASTIKLDGGVK
jgi:hypothetical protein